MDPRLQRRVQRYGWDKASLAYEQFWRRQLAPVQERVLALADVAPGADVLDVACGTGLVTFPAARAAGAAGRVVGVDLSQEMVNLAAEQARTLGLAQVRFERMDAEALTFDAASFDVALCAGFDDVRVDRIATTFGVRRPIVLLPRRVGDLPPDARRAVVCHELLHVARHDWAWTVGEEIVQTIFWFHPAMWWALGQVQLSREQTVDEMVVAVTAARVPYMNALMMFADARPGLTSALPFVRRHQLASRLRQLSKEHTMSSLRLGFTGVVLAGVLIGSSYAVASAVPLRARANRAQDATPKRVPKLLKETKPEYPAGLKEFGISAVVMVNVDVSASGAVTRAEATSWSTKSTKSDPSKTFDAAKVAPEPFLDAATAAARQWRFVPADSDTTVDIEFDFTARPDAAVPGGVEGGVRGGVVGGVLGGVPGGVGGGRARGRVPGGVAGSARPGEQPKQTSEPLRVGGAIKPPRKIANVAPVYPEDARAAHVQGVVVMEVTIAKDGSVSNARVLWSVPMLDRAAIDAVTQWVFEPTLLNGAPVEVVMTVTVNFTAQ